MFHTVKRALFPALIALCTVLTFLSSCAGSNSVIETTKGDIMTTIDITMDEGAIPSHATSKGSPEVWMSQRSIAQFTDYTKWDYVSKNLNTLSFFIDDIKKMTKEDIDCVRNIQRDTGVNIVIELAGLCDWFVPSHVDGENTLADLSVDDPSGGEYAAVERFTEAGIRVDYLDFDHPITRAMHPGEDYVLYPEPVMTLEEAARQLAQSMVLWRAHLPEVKFIFCSNFPNYSWKDYPSYFSFDGKTTSGRGDMFTEMNAAVMAAEDAGVEFWGFVADNPYDYLNGLCGTNQSLVSVKQIDWTARLLDFEKEVKALGLKFAVFFNSSMSGTEGPDAKYYLETMSFINQYTEKGGNPDVYYIESWYKHPTEYLPEDKLYTQAYITAQVIKQVREGIIADLSSPELDFTPKAPDNLTLVKSWSFTDELNGWTKNEQINDFKSADGVLKLTSTGIDPYLFSPAGLNIDTSECVYLYLKVKNRTVSTTGQMFFITDTSPSYVAGNSFSFAVEQESEEFQDIYVRLDELESFSGTLKQFRIDPCTAQGDIEIESITIYSQG
ncbi:MAG: hypothetical protein AB9835_14115 [Eubacteriales bacterium]